MPASRTGWSHSAISGTFSSSQPSANSASSRCDRKPLNMVASRRRGARAYNASSLKRCCSTPRKRRTMPSASCSGSALERAQVGRPHQIARRLVGLQLPQLVGELERHDEVQRVQHVARQVGVDQVLFHQQAQARRGARGAQVLLERQARAP